MEDHRARRRARLVLVLGMCLVAAGTAATVVRTESDREPPRRSRAPNVILVTTDDMRADDLAWMPHTRALLGERGVTFTDGISPYSLCCPSRAAIVTGQYSHNNGVRGNAWPNGGYWRLTDGAHTLPTWLQRAGYNTGFVGKYLNQYGRKPDEDSGSLAHRDDLEVPPGWTHWYGAARRVYAYTGVDLWAQTPGSAPHWRHVDKYQTSFYTTLANRMVRRYSRDDRPFFVWLSHVAPHTAVTGRGVAPPTPHPSDRRPPRSMTLPLNKRFHRRLNEDTCDKGGPMRCLPKVHRSNMRLLRQRRIESLQSVDRGVERLVTTLKATGAYDDTAIIFTSDNGFSLGEHRFRGKDKPYEVSLRVPVIVSAPGIQERYLHHGDSSRVRRAGSTVKADYTVTTQDLTATILAIAGADHPGRQLDGIDMTKPRNNPDHHGDRAVLIESGPVGKAFRPRSSKFVGVRTDRWTWFSWHVESPDDGEEQTSISFGDREFYDLLRRPAQIDNLFGRGRHRAASRRLATLTRQMWDCRGHTSDPEGDSCVRWWARSP